MGASLITSELPSEMSMSDIERKFRELSEQAAYDHGHEYSGSWNMFDCVDFEWDADGQVRVFDSIQAAIDHICKVSEKYGPALAVKFKTQSPAGPSVIKWLIGGMAAC